MTSMFVPEPVISLAIKPKDQKRRDQHVARRSTASPRKTRPSACSVDPESNETIIAGMGELHLDVYIERMKREYKAEVDDRRSRRSPTARPSPSASSSTTRTRSRPAARASTAASPATSSRSTRASFEFVDEITGGAIPREFIPLGREGLPVDAARRARSLGFPVDRRPRDASTTAQSHAVDSSRHRVPGGRPRRVPRGLPARREPHDPRADHEGRRSRARPSSRATCIGGLNAAPRHHHRLDRGGRPSRRSTPRCRSPRCSATRRRCARRTQGKAEFTMEFARYRQCRRA